MAVTEKAHKCLRLVTINPHKLSEFQEILSPWGFTIRDCRDLPPVEVVEDGATFGENAVKKVLAAYALGVEQLNDNGQVEGLIADDSGLEVPALGGLPGIYSARYASLAPLGSKELGTEVVAPELANSVRATTVVGDQANNQRLLQDMAAFPGSARSARYVCALAYLPLAGGQQTLWPAAGQAPLIFYGEWLGRLETEARGRQGFGYDPLFLVPSQGVTAAELAPSVKNRLSHRFGALQALANYLAAQQNS